MPRLLYALLVAVVGFVSAYDVYLSIKYQEVLYGTEENPLGRWLIEQDEGDVALFMTVKMIGTALVLVVLPILYRFRRAWGWMTASSLASFQLSLLVYLTCA